MGVNVLGSVFIPDNMRTALLEKWIKLHPLDKEKKFFFLILLYIEV